MAAVDPGLRGIDGTWPTLPRHPRDVERIADGCANHSLDAVRYGVQWYQAKWRWAVPMQTGTSSVNAIQINLARMCD